MKCKIAVLLSSCFTTANASELSGPTTEHIASLHSLGSTFQRRIGGTRSQSSAANVCVNEGRHSSRTRQKVLCFSSHHFAIKKYKKSHTSRLWCEMESKTASAENAELDSIFDQCVCDLELNGGYALLPLPPLSALCHYAESSVENTCPSVARAFGTARAALNAVSESVSAKDHRVDKNDGMNPSFYGTTYCRGSPLIDPASDSGSWTGYHNAAVVNGRYNEFREGFVFSNGEMFDVAIKNEGTKSVESESRPSEIGMSDQGKRLSENSNLVGNFNQDMNGLFHIMHNVVANGVLRAIERRLDLPYLYFQNEVGPTDTSSQWHMKRYIVDLSLEGNDANETVARDSHTDASTKSDAEIFLPVHTDPSLISVVVLDRPGKNEGAMGLEAFSPNKLLDALSNDNQSSGGTWKEISYHGHDVATVFVGSVLSYLTKGQIFPAVKHRVVNWGIDCQNKDADITDKNTGNGTRMAATLFVRPQGDALMKILPSPHLHVDVKPTKVPPTFRSWNARVAKNYMKKKQKQSKK